MVNLYPVRVNHDSAIDGCKADLALNAFSALEFHKVTNPSPSSLGSTGNHLDLFKRLEVTGGAILVSTTRCHHKRMELTPARATLSQCIAKASHSAGKAQRACMRWI